MSNVRNKREMALQATLELISEQGLSDTPMSQIAERANIGVGTIYRYFNKKEDLINALYIDIKTRLSKYVLSNYSKEVPVDEGFKQFFRGVIHYTIHHPQELSFAEQYENSPIITQMSREKMMHMNKPLDDLLQRAMAQNLLKDLPFEMLNVLIYNSVIGLAKLYLSSDGKLDITTIDAGLDAIWDMVKK